MRRANYEVQAEWITLEGPSGRAQNFPAGSDLPDWVTPEQIKTLLDNHAIQEFEVLGHGR